MNNAFSITPQHIPIVLIILDGFGYTKNIKYNAIANATTPNLDKWLKHYPHGLLHAAGQDVGLPNDQPGNSEAGHLVIGAGRVVLQDQTRINEAIDNGEFYRNSTLNNLMNDVVRHNTKLHVFTLLSDGGVHSHEDHLYALIKLAKKRGVKQLYIHAFLDGRDTPPKSALIYISRLNQQLAKAQLGMIATISGRYYSMDRDNRWDRISLIYQLLTEKNSPYTASSAEEALQLAYKQGQSDEFVTPTCIQKAHQSCIKIQDGDSILFMNYRPDRARELTRAFTEKNIEGLNKKRTPKLSHFVTLTNYGANIQAEVVFPDIDLKNGLGEYLARLGLRQLRIAETEKYAHVTYFFNLGIEKAYPYERRLLIPSLKTASYETTPQMSATLITEKLLSALQKDKYDVVIVNFANADMVGHTGNYPATVKAIESLDQNLGKIVPFVLSIGGEVIITADHGKAEIMFNEKYKQPQKAHTTSLVPFLYIGRKARLVINDGGLADIAPTILYLLGLPIPKEMKGHTLINIERH